MNLRCVHLLTHPESEREQRSIAEVSKLSDFDIDYVPIVNPIYDGELPLARECNDRPFELTKAHYGCYSAHRDAIIKYLTEDVDTLLVCECDCVFVESPEEIYQRILAAERACREMQLVVFTFGFRHNSLILEERGNISVISQFIETHCYLVPKAAKPVFADLFSKPFDALDYTYTIYLYDQAKQRIGTFRDRPVAVQARGMSLIDHKLKISEEHFRNVRYQP